MTTAGSPTLEFLLNVALTHGARGVAPGRPLPRSPIEIPDCGRLDLAAWFQLLGFRRGVEVGVKEGDYSVALLEANPDLHLWSVDPWLVREEYHDRRGQPVFDDYESTARRSLGAFGVRSEILKERSAEAHLRFGRRSLDFVYIDGHHNLYNVIHDLHVWSGRVRPGGIVAGHDFARYKNQAMHVVQGVHAYTDAYLIAPWFVLGTKAKVEGQTRDRHRSFAWVRPGYEADMRDYDPTKGGLAVMPE